MEKASEEEAGDKEVKEGDVGPLDSVSEVPEESDDLLVAIPPPFVQHTEEQTETVVSPAFNILDDLYKQGLLSSTKAGSLKQKYHELHQVLTLTRTNVVKLYEEHASRTVHLHRLSEQLDKANEYPKNITMDTEANKLRDTLLRYRNRYSEVNERLYHLEFKIECMEDEKAILQKESARLPKEGELEEKIKHIQKITEEMRKEIYQKCQDLKQLQEEHGHIQSLYEKDEKEYEKLNEKIALLKSEFLEISSLPNQTAKETDKLSRKKNEVEKKKNQVKKEYDQCLASLMQLQKQAIHLEKDKNEMREQIDRILLSQLEMEAHIDHKWKAFQLTKEKVAQLKTERDELDISLCQALVEKKKIYEMFTLKSREKEMDTRLQKKSELQLKVAADNFNQVKTIYDKMNVQKESIPGVDEDLQQRKNDLLAENEMISRNLESQKSLTAMEHVRLERSAENEQNLLYDQSDIRTELKELKRLSTIKTEERDQKAREKKRADSRYRDTKKELTSKYIIIEDHKKKYKEKKSRLKTFAKKYELIKNDRNKYVTLIQTCTQKAGEMREKIKILQNEIEILRTAVLQKDKQLHKERLRHMHSVVVRDGLRNELDKQHRVAIELDERYDQQKMETMKLNYMINQAEDQMIKLRKRYENAIQARNKKGEALIKLNSDVCLFYEKHNVQKDLIKRGNIEMENLEQELKILHLEKNMYQRELSLLQKELPDKRNLLEELTTSQIQLTQCRNQSAELEKSIINRTDESAIRFLAGKDPSPEELQDKIKKTEMQLAEVEMQLMEKELIDEQVTHLCERIKCKAELGKDDTLDLAKKINDLQHKIKDTTRKMMALTAEVSMKQASNIMSQKKLKEMEQLLELCYVRMERGEAPTEEMEQEWLKLMQREQQQKLQQQEKQLVKDEENLLDNGEVTTAEQRPNAYIPDDETELPIPRPYGKHAPFKPTETGSNMRYIRKPNPKPIEI